MKLLAFDGKHKIADKYEENPYIVEQQDYSVPVYTVRREDGQGRKKVLHRNHLLPISDLPIPSRAEDEEKPKYSIRLKTHTPTPSLKSDDQERVFELGGEESDDQLELILMQEPDASAVDEVHQPASPVPVCEVRQVILGDILQPDALPPPIGWDEQLDLVDVEVDVEVDQQADVSKATELEDTDDSAVIPPPPPLPDDTFPEDAGIPERRDLRRSVRTRGPPDR